MEFSDVLDVEEMLNDGLEPADPTVETFAAADEIEPMTKEGEIVDVPWLTIDLEHSGNGNQHNVQPASISSEVEENPKGLVLIEEPTASAVLWDSQAIETDVPPPVYDSLISGSVLERLNSDSSSERAAALADLTEIDAEDSFNIITKSLDDPAVEVRNAAARALYDFRSDRTASFTRALREASPERRRKIGAAIAGSGLATEAINNLAGEGRETTFDAYSLLFLMAKAGEVQPLLQAISRHPNVDVRLTTVKLLALSNQSQVLPALRGLAARETLPPDVHSAVMEAIYSISTQVRENAPSLA